MQVGIEPRQAARTRCAMSVGEPADYNLTVRLESDCLGKVLRVAAELEGGGNAIRASCFGKARDLDVRVFSIVRDDTGTGTRTDLGDKKFAVRLEHGRGAAN